MTKTPVPAMNRLRSELKSMLIEVHAGSLTTDIALHYAAELLLAGGVASERVVELLESPEFGDDGQEMARVIKVREGW